MPHHQNARQSAKNDRILQGLAIDEIAFGGAGVGRSDGKVIFVPFTIDGEIVDVRLQTVRRSYSLGKLETIQQASPHTVKAPCPYFQTCAGWDYHNTPSPPQQTLKK